MAMPSSDNGNRRERVRVQADDEAAVMLMLTEGDFYNLVDKDVRSQLDPALAEKLRDPAVVERWYQTLLRMKRAVEGVISSKGAEDRAVQIELRSNRRLEEADKARAEFMRWRAGSIRFKTGVEEKLTEAAWRRRVAVEHLLHTASQIERNAYAELNRHLTAQVEKLRDAITKHRDEIDSDDATEIDEELWAVLPAPVRQLSEKK